MTCPQCGKDFDDGSQGGSVNGIADATHCPLCNGELRPLSPGETSKPNVGMFLVGLLVYPTLWLFFYAMVVALGLVGGVGNSRGGFQILAVIAALLYVLAIALTFKIGSKSTAIGALVGMAVPLIAVGACFNI